ncbi:S-adenosyl-L-methionine-dependent methyltransferase [Endogone sp. FLAS-F59071]|nr:S-adenosyl-L-methionine-dependent methyltransferase [Endogone sp. FLAS-F59071]|eukprot:RUS12979.1 S-adenosyl-L-methionine-dependent methyltransferase [Endogone sp. FLAS-F59071]
MGSYQSKDNRRDFRFKSFGKSSKESILSCDYSDPPSNPNFANVRVIGGRIFHDVGSSAYFLPHDNREQDRLLIHHYCIKLAFQGNLIAPVEHLLNEGSRVLDVGCGPGYWALEVAHDFPMTDVYGIDLVATYPAAIRPANTHFYIGNIVEGLAFPDNFFDFIQMRTFIAALRMHEWPLAIKEIMRLLKPGGWVQLVEPDEKLWRLNAESNVFYNSLLAIASNAGLDLSVAKRIPGMMRSQGFERVDNPRTSIPIGPWRGQLGQMMADDLTEGFIGATQLFAPALELTTDEYERLVRKMVDDCNQCTSYHNWYGNIGCKPSR